MVAGEEKDESGGTKADVLEGSGSPLESAGKNRRFSHNAVRGAEHERSLPESFAVRCCFVLWDAAASSSSSSPGWVRRLTMACHFWTVVLSLKRREGIVEKKSPAGELGSNRVHVWGVVHRSPRPDGRWYVSSRCGAGGGVGVADAGTTATSPVPSLKFRPSRSGWPQACTALHRGSVCAAACWAPGSRVQGRRARQTGVVV